MAETAQKTRMTWNDYAALPDDGRRYEVIEGELIVSPAPTFRHQEVVAELTMTLRSYAETHGLGKVVASPVDVRLDEHTVCQPDILFIRKDRLSIVADQVMGAPDLVIEVLSPWTADTDRRRKAKLYAKFAVPHYWIVSPQDEAVILYRLAGDTYERVAMYQGADRFEAEPFAELTIDLSRVWPTP
jgi:Uma2 family endonuclease